MATTQILHAQQPDGPTYPGTGLRRSQRSSSSLFLATSPPLSSSPKSHSIITSAQHRERVPTPPPPPQSSADSSPRSSTDGFSQTASWNSTPRSSALSLQDQLRNDDDENADDDINFPDYNSLQLAIPNSAYNTSTKSIDDESNAPDISTTTDTTRSDSPLATPTVADDTMIREEPSRHVDYLSHDWREEDIWASWRHIVSQRRVYGQKSRLENASWRTWAKSKYRLRTVSPERLNWLKESDVTWLYGPLQPAQSHPITSDNSTPPSNMSKSGSFINKKPILKKRNLSEVMLQKSLSTSSLVKEAAASVQAQKHRHHLRWNSSRSTFDFCNTPSIPPSQPPSREDDYFSRRGSNSDSAETPSEGKEKHIRFDEVVEQCVAVDAREPGFDEMSENDFDDRQHSALSESSSDEGLMMMKRKREHARQDSSCKGKDKLSRTNSSSKMIETIPATTLKYRTDSPEVTEEAQHHVFGKNWSAGKLSPSPSQETLRPSRPSRNFLLTDDDDDDVDDETSTSWSFGANNPKSSLGASATAEPSSSRGRPEEYNPTDGYEGLEGMRRTESGMFMPIDEDEDDLVAAGLFGRVSETVNTVKDIGWVLWNVGFRNRNLQ